MTTYVLAVIWVLSAFLCLWIAKVRHVQSNTLWAIVVTILGPFAIPLVFLGRPIEPKQAD